MGAGMDATSAFLSAKMDKRGQKRAMRFAREVGQNKYQWAVGDLRKAGLSPILAVGGGVSGGGGPGIGAPASPRPSGFTQAGRVSYTARQEKENLRKTAGVLETQASANSARAVHEREMAIKTRADTAVSEAQQRYIDTQRRMIEAQLPGVQALENLYRARPELRYLKEFGPAGAGAAAVLMEQSKSSAKRTEVPAEIRAIIESVKRKFKDVKRKFKGKEPSTGGGGSF